MVMMRYIGKHQPVEERDIPEWKVDMLLETGEWEYVDKKLDVWGFEKSDTIEREDEDEDDE